LFSLIKYLLSYILKTSIIKLSSSIHGNPTIAPFEKIANILEIDLAELFTKPVGENVISGYLEFNREIHKIESISDVQSFVEIQIHDNV